MSAAADTRRLRAGIVGGGRGAFIGAVHRMAAELDGQALVVAGAMSSDAKTAAESARAWNLERSYASFAQMARDEKARADGIDFAIVATPNHLHFAVCKAFLDAGIHVVCDKPLAFTVKEAQELVGIVERSGKVFALTHNYTGYPAVRQARDMVRKGELGTIRKIQAEYQQDWLMEPLERTGNKQAEWRTDPARSGASGCVGDIGTHAESLLEFVTGLRIEALCAEFTTFVEGRRLEDDASILLRLQSGARGSLLCSQVACGEENNLRLRVYGTKAGLEWHQQEPNTLIFKPANEPWRLLRTGHGYMSDAARAVTRTPAGHPEGYLEAFATIYRDAIEDMRRSARGQPAIGQYPKVQDGLRGMQFLAAAVESAQRGAQWITLQR